MAAVQGPFPTLDDPIEAVAAACTSQGVRPEHVQVEPLAHRGTRAWHWRLTDDSPAVELRDILVFDTVSDRHGHDRPTGRAHHPKLDCGVVVEVAGGHYLVVADDEGGEAVEDLIAAGLNDAAAGRCR